MRRPCETRHPDKELVDGYRVRDHPNYNSWCAMKSRCRGRNKGGEQYVERGITYCDRWKHFKNFCQDMGMKPSPDHSLERKDNDKGYSPDNCVWATPVEQANNRRTQKLPTSGITGVYQDKRSGLFFAIFSINGRRMSVKGTFKTAEEAGEARRRAIDAYRD